MARTMREFSYPSRPPEPHVTPHLTGKASNKTSFSPSRRTPPAALTTNTYEPPTRESIGRG